MSTRNKILITLVSVGMAALVAWVWIDILFVIAAIVPFAALAFLMGRHKRTAIDDIGFAGAARSQTMNKWFRP